MAQAMFSRHDHNEGGYAHHGVMMIITSTIIIIQLTNMNMVHDPHTKDHKSQWNIVMVMFVKGEYTLDEADGTKTHCPNIHQTNTMASKLMSNASDMLIMMHQLIIMDIIFKKLFERKI
ncbi:hypothetical protein PVAND_015428 [Polypedilum vanderplanki]|uniref:Uncharacterized protein n=1 Tax=Polypedilum vanderplanki TaxID=319348 RepID=A0A9J6BCZ7_POLVA|nr:hypothetical protein PVAND_015428 [Polypedilum vanderplanki]